MAVHRQTISLETKGEVQAIDITGRVAEVVRGSGLKEGVACVFAPGSTCAIAANEFEPGLMGTDIPAALERLFPRGIRYGHEERWRDGNGHSHVRSAFLGQSFTFPFGGAKPLLGTWQQIAFLELDTRPRTREVIVQLVGE
jgi:secondary thiamine-phosphate synthase enzyme